MKIKIEIKNGIGKVLFEFEKENNSIKDTLIEANLSGVDLSGADLFGADLSGADLFGANLSGANLSGADLSGADLSRANLSEANLRGADLSRADLYRANLSGTDLYRADLCGADLSRANLRGADLSRADLFGANLSGADLRGADLSRANLSGADLNPIKSDFYLILLNAKNEVQGLKEALIAGKVDGSTYTGDCACLIGTIANVKNVNYAKLSGIIPDATRAAEKWFTNIKKGDTPETNDISKITVEWIDEFLELIK